MKIGSLVEVGLVLQRPSLARADMSYRLGLLKISTEGGVREKPGRMVLFVPGGPCGAKTLLLSFEQLHSS